MWQVLSETAARTRIQRKMLETAPSAQVQIAVQKGPLGSVSAVSVVSHPGTYLIDSAHFTVLNAVAAAGGAQGCTANPQICLIRRGKAYTKSMTAVLEDPEMDTALRGGDKLSVEVETRYFRSLGAASKEAIVPFGRDEITTADGLFSAGMFKVNSQDTVIVTESSVASSQRGITNPGTFDRCNTGH